MEVYNFRRKKAWSWGITFVGLLTAYIAVCPYICSSAHAEEKAVHSCCPESSQSDQHHNSDKKDSCCDQHLEETLLNKSAETFSKTIIAQPLFFITALVGTINLSNPTTVLERAEGPPMSMPDRPLYLVKNVFLI